MQGLLLVVLLYLLTLTQAFAIPAANATGSALHQAESQAESKAMATASESDTQPTPETPAASTPTTPTPTNPNYFELIGGVGPAKITVGKSPISVAPTETDWAAQQSRNWQFPFARLGIGYVYFLADPQRGYVDKFTWIPSIEPILTASYFNLNATGSVQPQPGSTLNGNPITGSSTFTLPVKTTSIMLDVSLTLAAYKRFALFLLGGLGESWSSIEYHDSPNNNSILNRPSLVLNARNQSNNTYEWGTGVTFAFNPRIALDLQYLYRHVGNIRTSGYGTLGGVPDSQISSAAFGLRTQAVMLDLHVALS